MKVDIWSDIRCPFCYIGKRKFEAALEHFEHKDKIEITWHSFELDPELKTNPDKDVHDYLAELKGASRDWSVKVHHKLTQTAKDAGLTYNFDKAVVANSFDAHRLIQLANMHGLGDAAEESLFKAYFTDGKNIDDHATLRSIGASIGLEKTEVEEMLASGAFANHVRSDEAQAHRIGVNGVPFFVFNDRYAVSGAQPSNIFFDTLQKSWKEFEIEKPVDNSIGNNNRP
jgi:predicted DsbA family dithiol-disulfide isomerase